MQWKMLRCRSGSVSPVPGVALTGSFCCVLYAASPCPPPPPPVFDPPDCPVPVPITGGTMWPTCFGGNCGYWGPAKAYDGKTKALSTLAIVQYATNPHMQLDLGSSRSDITSVRITSRADCCLSQSQNLNVYLSPTTSFQSGTLCDVGLKFARVGETVTVLCPVNATGRFLTILLNGTDYLSLQEVTPLYDGRVVRLCMRNCPQCLTRARLFLLASGGAVIP